MFLLGFLSGAAITTICLLAWYLNRPATDEDRKRWARREDRSEFATVYADLAQREVRERLGDPEARFWFDNQSHGFLVFVGVSGQTSWSVVADVADWPNISAGSLVDSAIRSMPQNLRRIVDARMAA